MKTPATAVGTGPAQGQRPVRKSGRSRLLKQALEARDVACGIDAATESFGAWEVGQEVGRLSVAVGRLADVVVALVRECER
jgi:hypothetical protein